MEKIKIVIVDDHLIFLEGVMRLLEDMEQIEIVKTATSGKEALVILKSHKSDIVLTDINMPGIKGLELCKSIKKKYPETKVIALTMFKDADMMYSLKQSGASGYVLKNAGSDELIMAIEKVYQGDEHFPDMMGSKQDQVDVPGIDYLCELTEREKEVLKLIAAELTTHEMAEKLHVSWHTIESHRKNLLQKFNARNTAGLIKNAMKNGMLN